MCVSAWYERELNFHHECHSTPHTHNTLSGQKLQCTPAILRIIQKWNVVWQHCAVLPLASPLRNESRLLCPKGNCYLFPTPHKALLIILAMYKIRYVLLLFCCLILVAIPTFPTRIMLIAIILSLCLVILLSPPLCTALWNVATTWMQRSVWFTNAISLTHTQCTQGRCCNERLKCFSRWNNLLSHIAAMSSMKYRTSPWWSGKIEQIKVSRERERERET